MVVNKIKKVNRYRGHSNHGGGARKKRRGAGSRGGRGRAGTGKRAGHKKAGIKDWKLGRTGFSPKNTVTVKAINLEYFTPDRLQRLMAEGQVRKEGEFIVIDLKQLGYNKLLGSGAIGSKVKIITAASSALAIEKVQAAGGQVISPS